MAENYVLLETIQLTQSAASVTFDNIPQSGYTDLKIVTSMRTDWAQVVDGVKIRFNGDTTSGNYTGRRIYGNGASAISDTNNLGNVFANGSNSTANTFSNCEVIIPNYLNSNAKIYATDNIQESNATTSYMGLGAQLWSGTAAITSINFSPEAGTAFVSGSTFSLYGIAATGTTPAVAPKATGGNMVSNDGTYWIHTFLTSGTFTPQINLTCDYLVVAGGGGGGSSNSVGERGAGGGGAGGYRYFTSQSFTANTSYSAVIGAGGASNSQGSTSSFNSTNATGGGYGGTSDAGGANSGGPGGSGGGAGQHPGTRNGGAGNAGSYSPVEGYAGTAITTDAPPYGGAPGGGSSGTATYTNPPTAPNNGTSNSISGSAVTYAVGGQGGIGAGGGATGTAGGANTGTGGQGGSGKSAPYQNTPGGAGGSGIVIIRYPMAS